MCKEILKHYIREINCLLKDYARQAKVDTDPLKEGDSADFNAGFLMAYHQVITTMKHQAPFFDLTHEELNLADIEPERDLV
jgi:hypothetical protein